MPDNRQNVELAPLANPPMHYPGNYPEPSQYGGPNNPGGESKLAFFVSLPIEGNTLITLVELALRFR